MQVRALIILLIAILLGGAAVWLLNTQFQPQEPQEVTETTTIETQPVVVTTEDVSPGDELQPVILKTVSWPSESVPEGTYSDVDRLMEGDTKPTLTREIRKGEPVLAYKLAGEGRKRGLTTKIPEGKRALTVAVNEIRGVAGFVLPGNRVDILHTTTAGRRADDQVTRILEQNLLVLGVDQEASEEKEEPEVVNAVTLLVDPSQAQRLTLAQSVGDLSLVLRNQADDETPHPDVVATHNLTTPPLTPRKPVARSQASPEEEPTQPSGPAKRDVEVIRGLTVDSETVPELPENSDSETDSEADGNSSDRKAD